ncbi:MAG: AraC family transcriptional regulator, partial [Tannerellaceae bacterium]
MVYNLALLLPCAMCLIGAAWLICNRKSNTRAQNILVVGFLASGTFFLTTANYIVGNLDSSTLMWWDIVDSFGTMLIIPTMHLYFLSTILEKQFTWREYIWFAPALVVGIGVATTYMLMDKTQIQGFIQTVLIDREENSIYTDTIYKVNRLIGYRIYHLITLIQIAGVVIFAVRGVREYHQRLRDFYSDADDKAINSDNKTLRWCILTIPMALALIIPDIRFWGGHPVWISILFIAWAVVYFALFYISLQKKYRVENFVQDLRQADLDEKSYCDVTEAEELNVDNGEMLDRQISEQVYQRLMIQFTRLIDVEKIYLKRDLRLDEVARLMFTNRAYVSKVIKEKYKCSFSDYINGKRIDFSMELMRLNPTLTQDKIAEQAGFINAQSYSRTFKKLIG